MYFTFLLLIIYYDHKLIIDFCKRKKRKTNTVFENSIAWVYSHYWFSIYSLFINHNFCWPKENTFPYHKTRFRLFASKDKVCIWIILFHNAGFSNQKEIKGLQSGDLVPLTDRSKSEKLTSQQFTQIRSYLTWIF